MDNVIKCPLSVIVTTYNRPDALSAVLEALIAQKTTHPFEVIIADDGSSPDTAALIRALKQRSRIPLLHVWQPDEGFRVSAIRNKAILAAEGDYLIFLDGDCIPRDNFIERHFSLMEPEAFVVGNRVLLNEYFTKRALQELLPLYRWSGWQWFKAFLKGYVNRWMPFLTQPFHKLRCKTKTNWKGAKGCNLGVFKSDLININGWEENFVGWGYEDSDLVIRLLRVGVRRKSARFYIPVIHLWHLENDRTQERANWGKLKTRLHNPVMRAEKGLNQYAV